LGAPGFEVEDAVVGAPRRPDATVDDLAAIAGELGGWPAAAATETEDGDAAPAPIDSARAGFEVTSYTKLAHATPDDFRADAEVGPVAVPPGELPAGAATGIFLHDVLEHVDFASAQGTTFAAWRERDDVRAVIDQAARRHGIADRAHLD